MGGTPRAAGKKAQREGSAETGRYVPLGGLPDAQSATPDRETSLEVVEHGAIVLGESEESVPIHEEEGMPNEEKPMEGGSTSTKSGLENPNMVHILLQQMQSMQQMFNCAMEDREKDRKFLLERDKEQQMTISRLMEERSRTPSERGDALSANNVERPCYNGGFQGGVQDSDAGGL